jgi:hypothetical protein
VSAAQSDALVAVLARATVEKAAPEELPLFRPTSEAYFADPQALERSGDKEAMLGFGVDAAMVLMTPVVLQVAKDVIGFLGQQLRERAAAEGEGAIDRMIARIVNRDGGGEREGEPAAELTDEQLEQVRAFAIEKGRALKLSDERATLLADSLVGSLATA